MSDAGRLGDAARLDSALDRIARALDRGRPGAGPPGGDQAPGSGPRPDPGDEPAPDPGPDLGEVALRLDGLIAELRDVLGEAAPPA